MVDGFNAKLTLLKKCDFIKWLVRFWVERIECQTSIYLTLFLFWWQGKSSNNASRSECSRTNWILLTKNPATSFGCLLLSSRGFSLQHSLNLGFQIVTVELSFTKFRRLDYVIGMG